MDERVREYLGRARQAALDVPPEQRGPGERAVLRFCDALTYAMIQKPISANDRAQEMVHEIAQLNKLVQIAAEKERGQ